MLTRVSVPAARVACSATRLSNQALSGAPRRVPRFCRRHSSGTPSGGAERPRPHQVVMSPAEAATQTTGGNSGGFLTGVSQTIVMVAGLATVGLGVIGYIQIHLDHDRAVREAKLARLEQERAVREAELARLQQERAEREARERDVVTAVLSASEREDELHLSRAVDEQLRGLMFKDSGAIYIVAGPRGAGKSQAIRAAVHGQPGGILVKMKGGDILEERIAALLRQHGASKATPDDVHAMLQKVIAAKRAEAGHPVDWVPTLVIEVDQQFPTSEIDALMNAAKDLGPDRHLCAPFVIFSDMRAALAPDNMGARVEHIRVTDFAIEEVEQLAELMRSAGNLHASMATPEQRREFVRMYGSRAGLLAKALTKGHDVGVKYSASWAAQAFELWQCKPMPEERAVVRTVLKALAHKYLQAKTDAEASGSVLRMDEIAITPNEAKLTARQLAKIITQLGEGRAVQADHDQIVFISPVGAERILELWSEEQTQERLELERKVAEEKLELERKEAARPWYQKLLGLR